MILPLKKIQNYFDVEELMLAKWVIVNQETKGDLF
jgi:hypothetical protein